VKRVRHCYTPDFNFAGSGQRAAILRYNFLPFAAARRAALLAVGGFDEALRNIPDWDLWMRMILGGSSAGLVDEPLAEYRLSTTNVTSDRARVHRGKLETLEKAARRSDLSDSSAGSSTPAFAPSSASSRSGTLELRCAAGEPGGRQACLRVVRTKGVGLRAKLNALAGMVAPRTAGRALERRDRAGVEITAGLRVGGHPSAK
jgi:hypothetical protein